MAQQLTKDLETHTAIGHLKSGGDVGAIINGEGHLPFYTVFARSFEHTPNIQVVIDPQGQASLDALRSMQPGSYIALIHKALRNREIEVSRIELTSELIKADNTIQMWFNNPIYKDNLFVTYHIETSSAPITGQYAVLHIDGEVEKSNSQTPDNRNRVLDIQQVPEQEYVVTPFAPTLMLHLNFNTFTPVEFGKGKIAYTGGGNRFVQNKDNILVIQELNKDPMYNRYPAYSEISLTNLLENDFLNGLPAGYEVESNPKLIMSQSTFQHAAIQGANGFQILIHDSQGIAEKLRFNTPMVPISSLLPVTFSMFLGIQPYISGKLNKVNINFMFYSGASHLGTVVSTVNPETVINTIGTIQGVVNSTNIPVGTTNVKVQVEIEGFDRGERFVIQMILPQLAQTLVQTTPILNSNIRFGDVYKIPQQDNVNLVMGAIELLYVPGLNDTILPCTLFDTTQSGIGGLRARILSNRNVEFTINNGTLDQTIIGGPVNLQDSEEVCFRFEWDSRFPSISRRLFYNYEMIHEDLNPFSIPSALNADVYIGSNSDGQEQVNGKLNVFKIFG